MPRGHVKLPGSLPRPPNWNSCRRFCRYCVLGDIPATPVIPTAAVGEVGEPSPFFESSSELPNSLAWRNGRPRLSLRDADDVVLLGVIDDDGRSNVVSLALRFPYLFFKYLAHELRFPSLSSAADDVVVRRSGEFSRDLSACDERDRDKSDPPPDNDDDVPYLLRNRLHRNTEF